MTSSCFKPLHPSLLSTILILNLHCALELPGKLVKNQMSLEKQMLSLQIIYPQSTHSIMGKASKIMIIEGIVIYFLCHSFGLLNVLLYVRSSISYLFMSTSLSSSSRPEIP